VRHRANGSVGRNGLKEEDFSVESAGRIARRFQFTFAPA
jgi:hypothetical protein